MRVVALGASGNAGRQIVASLAPELLASDELVLAGRNPDRLAASLAVVKGPPKVTTAIVDLADLAAVRKLMVGADLAIVTASRPDLVADLARITLEAGADWFDTLLSSPAKLAALQALTPEIIKAGCCFVTDGGFHPGLPAAMVRWACSELDEVTEADVIAGMRTDWRAETLSESTIAEMLAEFDNFDLTTLIDGERRRLRWTECPTVDFGDPIGVKVCLPMPLAEMGSLPDRYPTLRRCGFYISGFSPLMDYAMLPLLMAMVKVPILRRPAIRLTRWSLLRLASYPPPHRLTIQMSARGRRGERDVVASARISGEDGYLLTSAPAVVCLRHLINREVRHPGVHLQAHLLPPQRFLAELADLGLSVEARVVPVGAEPSERVLQRTLETIGTERASFELGHSSRATLA